MKKLLATLLVLTALQIRPMDKEKQIASGLLTTFGLYCAYSVYRIFNPTIEDFKREQEAKDRTSKANIEIGKRSLEYDNYKKRCLEAGKILEQ